MCVKVQRREALMEQEIVVAQVQVDVLQDELDATRAEKCVLIQERKKGKEAISCFSS